MTPYYAPTMLAQLEILPVNQRIIGPATMPTELDNLPTQPMVKRTLIFTTKTKTSCYKCRTNCQFGL